MVLIVFLKRFIEMFWYIFVNVLWWGILGMYCWFLYCNILIRNEIDKKIKVIIFLFVG